MSDTAWRGVAWVVKPNLSIYSKFEAGALDLGDSDGQMVSGLVKPLRDLAFLPPWGLGTEMSMFGLMMGGAKDFQVFDRITAAHMYEGDEYGGYRETAVRNSDARWH